MNCSVISNNMNLSRELDKPIGYYNGRMITPRELHAINNGCIVLDLFSYAKEGSSKGCLMAMVGPEQSKQITDFANQQIKSDTLADDGLEKNPHITVLYGFDPAFSIDSIENLLCNEASFDVTLGSISRFECPEYDVIKAEVKSEAIHKIHHSVKKAFADSISSKHPSYYPHLTLGYVKKGTNKHLDGHNFFEGKKVSFDSLLFSPPNKDESRTLDLGKRV